jgi:hypothetical protein
MLPTRADFTDQLGAHICLEALPKSLLASGES